MFLLLTVVLLDPGLKGLLLRQGVVVLLGGVSEVLPLGALLRDQLGLEGAVRVHLLLLVHYFADDLPRVALTLVHVVEVLPTLDGLAGAGQGLVVSFELPLELLLVLQLALQVVLGVFLHA